MLDELLIIIEHQKQLLREMLELAKQQQKALAHYKAEEAEQLAQYQNEVSGSMKQLEDRRIRLIMNSFGISRRDASGVTLSQIEKSIEDERVAILGPTRQELNTILLELQKVNTMNRLLANRARTGIQEILSLFTDGTVKVVNMKV